MLKLFWKFVLLSSHFSIPIDFIFKKPAGMSIHNANKCWQMPQITGSRRFHFFFISYKPGVEWVGGSGTNHRSATYYRQQSWHRWGRKDRLRNSKKMRDEEEGCTLRRGGNERLTAVRQIRRNAERWFDMLYRQRSDKDMVVGECGW